MGFSPVPSSAPYTSVVIERDRAHDGGLVGGSVVGWVVGRLVGGVFSELRDLRDWSPVGGVPTR
jgi:hypothetical protein